jgi:hypothetical protein
MEVNNQSLSTGAKGVFPGTNQMVAPIEGSNPQSNPPQFESANPQNNVPQSQIEINPSGKTYFRMETKNIQGQLSGILEIDLISFREKGEESRYVKFLSVGASGDGTGSETSLSIDNEEDFNRFKKFVSELNWND